MSLFIKTLVKISLFIYFSLNIFAQDSLATTHQSNSKTYSRLKFSGGYDIERVSGMNNNFLFVNLSYRATLLKKDSSTISAGFASEIGVNVTYYKAAFPIFIKIGPEIRFGRNFLVDLNAGFIGILVIRPDLMYGINFCYLTKISSNIYIEAETGFKNSLYWDDDNMYYISLGVSFN